MTTKAKTRKAAAMPDCLPSIDRRSLALPSAASMSDDPVFQAMAELEQLKSHVEELDAASVAEQDECELAARAVWDAEYDVMEAEPATTAGAVALLRFVADLMGILFLPKDDEHDHYIGAICNAADFFERNASA